MIYNVQTEDRMYDINLGGYDDNAFYEIKGNCILKMLLESKFTIKTCFAEGDKGINLDGYYELLKQYSNKKIPCAKIEVQIKTMNKSYINENKYRNKSKYKYSCETKAFNCLRNNITRNPIMLFLVDTSNQICFWKHISFDYLTEIELDSENNKMIYFDDSDSIKDVDIFWKMSKDIYDNMTNIPINPIISSTKDLYMQNILQKAWDYLSNLFDYKFQFLKDYCFADVWKFGIAFRRGEAPSASTLVIFKIIRGENGDLIRTFINDSNDDCDLVKFIFIFDGFESIKEKINDFFLKTLKDYFFKYQIHPKYLPTIVLEEIVFDFLDTISKCIPYFANTDFPNRYFKDTESLYEVQRLLNATLIIGDELAKYCLEILPESTVPLDTITVDPIGSLLLKTNDKDKLKFIKIWREYRKDRVSFPFKLSWSTKSYNLNLIEFTLFELESRQINKLNRLWISFDNSIDSHYNDLLKLYTSLSVSYNETITKLFNNCIDNYDIALKCDLYFSKDYFPYDYGIAESGWSTFEIDVHNDIGVIKSLDDLVNHLSINYPNSECYIINGSLKSIFQNNMPLYIYITLLIYSSICKQLNLKGRDYITDSLIIKNASLEILNIPIVRTLYK